MSKFRYILFDWDGCLIRSLDVWLKSYQKTFAEFNTYPSDQEITSKVFGDWHGPTKFGVKDIDLFTGKLLKLVDQHYATAPLYPRAKQILYQLIQDNYHLALLTSSKRSTIKPALIHHQLENIFDVILTAESVAKHKPDPEIIIKALEQIDGNPTQALIIGDSPHDIQAGKNAGITTVAFYPPENHLFYSRQQLESIQPDHLITKLSDLIPIINSPT
jgi:pyrophosphatase PpaX